MVDCQLAALSILYSFQPFVKTAIPLPEAEM
jgi:hypothetical protein